MNRQKYQTLFSSTKTLPKQIEQFGNSFDQNSIPHLVDLLIYLQLNLTIKTQPHTKLNTVLCLLTLVKKSFYPCVTLVQNIFLQLIQHPARVAASKNHQQIYDYFEKQGFKSALQNLQSLSYHFTHHSLDICLLLAYIKPKRLYRSKQQTGASKAKQFEQQLFQKGLTEQTYTQIQLKYSFLSLKKLFLSNLITFNKDPHNYIDFFMKQLQNYLVKNVKTTPFNWFKVLCRQGDTFLTSEALARLIQIFCYHNSFNIKKSALTLISQFIYWGDLEALLMVNFTEYFPTIALKLIQGKQRGSLREFGYFPQIEGQVNQKQLFVGELLLSIERWASLFPSLDSYFIDSGESPIYQLYINLLKNDIKFPVWQGQQQLQKKVTKNFRAKKQHNLLFLQELDRQKNENNTLYFNPYQPSFKAMEKLYFKNLEHYQKLIDTNSFDTTSYEWKELMEFKNHFEQYMQRMSVRSNESKIDILIQNGLQLQGKINMLQQILNKQKNGILAIKNVKDYMKNQKIGNYEEKYEKMSSIKESIRSKSKDSIRLVLNESGEQIKQKLNVKVQQLAKKRSEIIKDVSHLQLNSRPFLANKLHSQQIIQNFLPIIHFHPLRKQKRMKAGIKLVKQKQTNPFPLQISHNCDTPKFQSVVEDYKKSTKGIKVRQYGNKYEKYCKYLQDRQNIKYFTNFSILIFNSQMLKIQRTKLNLEKRKIYFKFHCESSLCIKLLHFQIEQQPAFKIQSKTFELRDNICEILIVGQILKIGYQIPKISFIFQNQKIKQVPLPFAFNNFLQISGFSNSQNLFLCKHCSQGLIEKTNVSTTLQLLKYFNGLSEKDKKVIGKIKFSIWQCNLRLSIQESLLIIQVQSEDTTENNFLFAFLPVFIQKMLTTERQKEKL